MASKRLKKKDRDEIVISRHSVYIDNQTLPNSKILFHFTKCEKSNLVYMPIMDSHFFSKNVISRSSQSLLLVSLLQSLNKCVNEIFRIFQCALMLHVSAFLCPIITSSFGIDGTRSTKVSYKFLRFATFCSDFCVSIKIS